MKLINENSNTGLIEKKKSVAAFGVMLLLAFVATLVFSSNSYSQKNKIKEYALTAKTQFALVDNHKIAYRKFGKGTPMFIANRFRGTLDTWDPLFLDLLAEKNTVIIFDYSGIGYSEGNLPLDLKEVAAETAKLADYLKIDKFNVMGWSYGGLVAQYVTFLHPTRVLKTVVIGSNPPGKSETPLQPAFLAIALKPTYTFEEALTTFFEPSSEKSRAAGKASFERISKRLDISKVPATQAIFQRYFAAQGNLIADKENFRGAYSTLKTPVLVISGDHDISFALENWYPLIRKSPTTQIIVLPDSDHAPQFQYPELATQYINVFLKNL